MVNQTWNILDDVIVVGLLLELYIVVLIPPL